MSDLQPDATDGSTLAPILAPRSIAVIGASRTPGSIGRQVLENLLDADYQGIVHPVNPNARSVSGVRAYESIGAIPDPVDLAVIVVPAEHVLDVAEACGQAGVLGLVVISAGFREVGPEGAEREQALDAIADRYGMRVVGPNCMGVLNTAADVRMNATFSRSGVTEGGLAFVSQSGALGIAILEMAEDLSLGLSHFVSLGNRIDVSSNDLLAAWETDDRVEQILLYLEHFGNPRNFIDVARRVSPSKPILAVKSGRSTAGARAAASHTGALAEQDVLTEALFEQCGVIRADTIEEVFAYARLFARAPPPPGRKVAILTNSGGPGIMAVDAMSQHGLKLAELSEATQERLAKHAPSIASVGNPVDITGSGDATAYRECLQALLEDDAVDDVLVIYTPPTVLQDEEVVEALTEPDPGQTPVVFCVLGRGRGQTAFDRLTQAGRPTYTFPESAIKAMGAYADYVDRRDRPQGAVPELPDVDPARAEQAVQASLGEDGWLAPDEVHDLLDAYGIETPEQARAESPEEAVEAVEAIGAPCVLKAIAPGLVHKSDVGGLEADVDANGAAEAYQRIAERVAGAGHDLDGVLVQRQVPEGREVILGMSADRRFGPLIAFGLGGVHVEVLKDVVFRLAPLTDAEAARMVRAIRGYPILEGVRGEAPADVDAIEAMLLRLSQLVRDRPEIQEMDLNPVIVGDEGEGAVCVDARVRLWPDGEPERAVERGQAGSVSGRSSS